MDASYVSSDGALSGFELVDCREDAILTCSSCQLPCFDLMLLSCGHTLCREHGRHALGVNKCAHCSCKNTVEVPNLIWSAMSGSFTMKCIEKTKLFGLDDREKHICGWIGKLADLNEHHQRCPAKAHNHTQSVMLTCNHNLANCKDELDCHRKNLATCIEELRKCKQELLTSREDLIRCRGELSICRRELDISREELCKERSTVHLLIDQVNVKEGRILDLEKAMAEENKLKDADMKKLLREQETCHRLLMRRITVLERCYNGNSSNDPELGVNNTENGINSDYTVLDKDNEANSFFHPQEDHVACQPTSHLQKHPDSNVKRVRSPSGRLKLVIRRKRKRHS